MKKGRSNRLRIRFAEQLFKMGNHEKCKKVLREVLELNSEPNDAQSLKDHVAYYNLLSKIHTENENFDEAIKNSVNAHRLQQKLLTKYGREVLNVYDEKKMAGR